MFILVESPDNVCWVVDMSKMKAWAKIGFCGSGHNYSSNGVKATDNLKFYLTEGPFKTFDTFGEADKAAKKYVGLPTMTYADIKLYEFFTLCNSKIVYQRQPFGTISISPQDVREYTEIKSDTPVNRMTATYSAD